jgi:TM2 domain-containing membrane protein YozV
VNYYLSSSDHVTGPYEKEELLDSLRYGIIAPDSQICEDGTDDWQPISILTDKKKKAEIVPIPQTPFTELQQTSENPITVHNNYYNTKSVGAAVLLEVIPGVFLQTFGIGNLYAGNIATGIILMVTYWVLTIVNVLLVFLLVGFVTWPLTFIAYLIIAIVSAQKGVARSNWEMIMRGQRNI